jgi:two-component system, NtrC family, response regulator AtoC
MGCRATSNGAELRGFGNLPPEEVIFGGSRAMVDIRRSVERAANANIPVLFQGATGTGKEVLARFLHCCSHWANGAFVKVNCPAVPGALFESELFGYEKGAFTGAYETKTGRVELARGGTLFLDEIADLDLGLQAKLLQLLQDGEFCRIGAQKERQVQARIVCATNSPLHRAAKSGTFRQDLFYRISVLSIELPTLQQRSGDIPMLVAYFLEKYRRKYGRVVPPFSNSLLGRLQKYRWPGNIRQLENLINHYVVLESEQDISACLEDGDRDYLSAEIPSDTTIQLKKVTQEAVRRLERKIILQVLEANGWHRGLAARALNISYGALLYKIKEAGFPQKRRGKRPDDCTTGLPRGVKVLPPIRLHSSPTKGRRLKICGSAVPPGNGAASS